MKTTDRPTVPTLLAPYLVTEETALRYSSSLTLLSLSGSTESGEAYSLVVTRTGATTIRVTWNVSTLEAVTSYKTVRRAYWRKSGWSATFRSESKAVAFAAGKLATLRSWAAERTAVAA